jgi:hypothetical protein
MMNARIQVFGMGDSARYPRTRRNYFTAVRQTSWVLFLAGSSQKSGDIRQKREYSPRRDWLVLLNGFKYLQIISLADLWFHQIVFLVIFPFLLSSFILMIIAG